MNWKANNAAGIKDRGRRFSAFTLAGDSPPPAGKREEAQPHKYKKASAPAAGPGAFLSCRGRGTAPSAGWKSFLTSWEGSPCFAGDLPCSPCRFW